MGRGVYHPDTTVCAAGIIDGSLPRSGGLLQINRISGADTYNERPISKGMTVSQGNKSSWSFTTFKVNNVDMSKSDVRILSDEGLPAAEGRVEFRVSGIWGSVANQGTT
jgi:hypothetical protein